MDSPDIKHHDSSPSESPGIVDDEKLSVASSNDSQELLKTQQMEKVRAEKAQAIRLACDTHDVEALVSYATSEGGLIEDELRRKACK
jgi:hypothetical protein